MRVVVIGAGIVGTSVAMLRTARGDEVIVLDQGEPELVGSTGHAPGFIGEFGDDPVATGLAVATTVALAELSADGADFDRVGCIEVATSPEGARALRARLDAARAQGLSAELLTADEAAARAPELIDPARTEAALFFGADAVADAGALTALMRTKTEAAGAQFRFETPVTAIEPDRDVVRLQTPDGPIAAEHVVLCAGIWTSELASLFGVELPIVAVRHPYAWGRQVAPPARGPFVRFPEQHVYARWHGDRWGFGSYAHRPEPIEMAGRDRADVAWDGLFDPVLAASTALFARPDLLAPHTRLDGIFAVTPDNLPLVGRLTERVSVASAIWVTHSIGAAQVLDRALQGTPTDADFRLDPRRFAATDSRTLRQQALANYNDIYTRG